MCKLHTTTHLGCGHETARTELCPLFALRAALSHFSLSTGSSRVKNGVADARGSGRSRHGKDGRVSATGCGSGDVASGTQSYFIGDCDVCVRRKKSWEDHGETAGDRVKLKKKQKPPSNRHFEGAGRRGLSFPSSLSSPPSRRPRSDGLLHPLGKIQRKIAKTWMPSLDRIGRSNHAAVASELSFCCIGLPDRDQHHDYQ